MTRTNLLKKKSKPRKKTEEEVEASDDEEEEDTEDAADEDEEESKAEGQVSTDMLAKEAIEHIENTPLDELEGFVPEDEDRVTVQRALNDKKENS